MERSLLKLLKKVRESYRDDNFLHWLHDLEKFVAKVLAVCLVAVIFVSLFDLIRVLIVELWQEPIGFFNTTLIQLFGLFLNILIALELLENITAYLRKNVIQVELVLVTAIIAIARKVIIFDSSKYSYLSLIALGVATICLSVSYWLLKQLREGPQP
ncbi:phosphate-starvation-inducible PsiE family protein [Synechocystis sp. LKSZ1]|uniref:phosphate-starvation-inducible PsiE family protein n=1 Tax=Synechocystis sp. LKSZ1 TaxID=3144951 RepID=UPI00336BD245